MSHSSDPSPVNPLPGPVWLLFIGIAAVEGMFSLGEAGVVGGPNAIGWRLAAVNDYGFSSAAFGFMVETGRLMPEHLIRFVTFPFVHGSTTSAIFASVILLAMGKMVGEAMGGWAVVLLFVLGGGFGALIFAVLTNQAWLIGAYPNVYGLIGAYTFLLWQRQVASGGPQVQAFTLIGFLMGIQLIFGIFFQVGYGWVGELGGFVIGFGLTAFVMPGGMARVLTILRRR